MADTQNTPGEHRWLDPPLIDDAPWIDPRGASVLSSRMPALPRAEQVSRRLRSAGVDEIVLMHGTFVGNDVFGMMRGLSRMLPNVADQIAAMTKTMFDSHIGCLGNYDSVYERLVDCMVNPPAGGRQSDDRALAVRRFSWSGENHHLGRFDGVIDLLDQALRSDQCHGNANSRRRILVLAHSHGGNVMALATQLLASPIDQRRQWLASLRSRYRLPTLGHFERPSWHRVCEALVSPEIVWPIFDIATFGTPIRYRFGDISGGLVHFVHHHALDDDDPTRAVLPTSVDDLIEATGGDYVQQFGVAGTDMTPSPFAIGDWFSNRRIQKRFEPSPGGRLNLRRTWHQIAAGNRVFADGTTFLCRYPKDRFGAHRNMLGHAIYTHPMHMPHHMDSLSEHFYGS